jgi:hypothetical protein
MSRPFTVKHPGGGVAPCDLTISWRRPVHDASVSERLESGYFGSACAASIAGAKGKTA